MWLTLHPTLRPTLRHTRPVCAASVCLLIACGSRTGLLLEEDEPPAEPPAECLFDEDCQGADLCRPSSCQDGKCQIDPPIVCDDEDACTEDSCDPSTGECNYRELSFDQDGDGFNGPRAGYAPGSEGACGDDCDDTSPLAFPGGSEVCDGVDNDCNGVVDDGAEFELIGDTPLRLSQDADTRSGPAGLSFDGQRWAATIWGEQRRRQFRFLGISVEGEIEVETLLTTHNAGSYGGPIAWTGSIFGTAWTDDRQDGTLVAYFNRLDRNGAKLGPDLQLVDTGAFARDARLRYNGSEFLVFWDDFRGDVTTLYVQRVDLEGELIGTAMPVTPAGFHAEFASVSFGNERVGMAVESTSGDGQSRSIHFLSTEHDFAGDPALIEVDTDPGSHHVRFTGDRFTVVWSQQFNNLEIGEFVYGATFDEFGNPIAQKTALTPGGGHARGGSLLPLGDRSLLFWSDDVEGNYEVYVKTIDNDLNEVSPPRRLTFADGYSLGAGATFGPGSQVGVLFEDAREGSGQAYMLRLECVGATAPLE